jgi:hypothetical protein
MLRLFLDENIVFLRGTRETFEDEASPEAKESRNIGEYIQRMLRDRTIQERHIVTSNNPRVADEQRRDPRMRLVGKSISRLPLDVQVVYSGQQVHRGEKGGFKAYPFHRGVRNDVFAEMVADCYKSDVGGKQPSSYEVANKFKRCMVHKTALAMEDVPVMQKCVHGCPIPPPGASDYDIKRWAEGNDAIVVSQDVDAELESRLGSDRIAIMPVERSGDWKDYADELTTRIALKVISMHDKLV